MATAAPAIPRERWEHFEHTADVGVRGIGPSPAAAFTQVGHAFFALLAADSTRIKPLLERRIELSAPDLETLLYDYLNELVFIFDTDRIVFREFDLELTEDSPRRFRLRGSLRGQTFDPKRHEATVEPKGATYTGLRVERSGDRWIAQCVVDV